MANKKTIYHSELRGLGLVVVDVVSDVQLSKYYRGGTNGKYFVALRINGEERSYNSENDAVISAFNGPDGKSRKGQRLTIKASGGGKGQEHTAAIQVLTADWTPQGATSAPQPALSPQAAPAPSPSPAPPPGASQANPTPLAAPPAAPATPNGPKPPGMTANGRLFQIANLEMRVQCAMHTAAQKLIKERNINVTPETFHGMVGRAFIQLAREGFLDSMPYDHMLDIRTKEAQAAPTQPPPPAEAPGQ